MGLISKTLTIIFSFLLFISLVLGGISLTVNLSLDYETVQKEAAPFVESYLRDSLSKSASTGSKILDALFSPEWVQKIPFSTKIKASLTSKLISAKIENISLEEETQELINEFYYADYACGYWDCFKLSETPFFLISHKSQDYWKQNFNYFGIASLILIAILFLLVHSKKDIFVLTGILTLLASLPLWGIKKIILLISGNSISDFAVILFSKSNYVSTAMVVLGIALIALSIIFGLFGIGFAIYRLISAIKIKLPKIKKKTPKVSESFKEPAGEPIMPLPIISDEKISKKKEKIISKSSSRKKSKK